MTSASAPESSTARNVSAVAVIVAGGGARRLGGVSKPQLELGGMRLLDHAVLAAHEAKPSATVVVGDVVAPPGVIVTVESPPGSGPVAGLAAGLAAVTSVPSDWVLALASDMPRSAAAVPALCAAATSAAPSVSGAWLVDPGGRHQPLLALYRRAAIEDALAGMDVVGASMRALTQKLTMVGVDDAWGASADIDTWEDLAAFGDSATSGAGGARMVNGG